jgi:ABC-type uncharacterized transport system permease subunit
MSASNNSKTDALYALNPTRRRVMGIIFLLVAALIWILFSQTTDSSLLTTFKLSLPTSSVETPDLVFPTLPSLNIAATFCALIGAYQLVRGFGKSTNLFLGLVAGLLVFSFLSWGSGGGTINLTGLLNLMVGRASPLTIGAMAGILSERAGVFNIAIEGMMLSAAFMAALIASLTNLWVGMLAGILTGGLISVVHAVLCIKYKVNQIISGTIINIFSTGITSYLSNKFMQRVELQYLNSSGFFGPFEIPVLGKIPVIGPIFFNQNVFAYIMYVLVAVLTVALFYTKWGLRLRSVGEHPKAADTLGINVFKTRYMAVILGGLMAGLGGAFFTIGSTGFFNNVMTSGRGFIALAAMIFGKYTPVGSFGAGLLFGFAESLSTKLSILRFPVPSEFLLMLPYVVTMIALAGVVGRSQGPAAGGIPYEKESM